MALRTKCSGKTMPRTRNLRVRKKLLSWSEISREGDDMARQMREMEVAFGEPFSLEVKYVAWEILQQMNQVGGGRCLLVTRSGELGLGPISTQSSDVVAFIRNTRVPFILRNAQASRYTLVGEAYIHGFMCGEIQNECPPEFPETLLE
jgi:hypothetical protein